VRAVTGFTVPPTMRNKPTPVPQIAEDLRRLGLVPGDLVMVHASMRRIGEVDGRAAGVVGALDIAVGVDGTLLMYLDALPSENEPFDALTTSANPDNGVLAEVFRQMPGTLVNDHPDARFGVRGKGGRELLADLPWNDYYGPGSVLQRFVDARGKVLRLGADLDTVTLLHYAEYLTAVPNKRRVRRQHLVNGPNGPELRTVDCMDDTDGIADYPDGDYFKAIMREYFATGAASSGQVGQAKSELIDARHLVDFAVTWMNDHLVPSTQG
jgi:aminoglycoside N3'-acetyltransferase